MARLACLVATRPNFVKMAPFLEALISSTAHSAELIHAGQHYDQNLSQAFFRDLGLAEPGFYLGVGSGSHAYQTGRTMEAFEELLATEEFDAVIVAGDVNATLAGALVAAKAGLPLIHLESGLRSFDRSMPEEINRVVTDHLSDLCLTTTTGAGENLLSEGISQAKIAFVGNTMIDSLDRHLEEARKRNFAGEMGLESERYAVLTLHRPANVDESEVLADLLGAVQTAEIPLVFPVHPRTRRQIESAGISLGSIKTVDPLGYIDFISLIDSARLVLTDSGGIQEETTVLGVPCVTLRDNTERPETLALGSNHLAGREPDRIAAVIREVLEAPMPEPVRPEKWDGRASLRAARAVAALFSPS